MAMFASRRNDVAVATGKSPQNLTSTLRRRLSPHALASASISATGRRPGAGSHIWYGSPER